jgi:hypothetical protein
MVLYGFSTAPCSHVKIKVSPEPKNYAWWLRTEFIPVDKEVRGIPVEQLDASWRLASELTMDAIPKKLRCEDGCDLMKECGLSFYVPAISTTTALLILPSLAYMKTRPLTGVALYSFYLKTERENGKSHFSNDLTDQPSPLYRKMNQWKYGSA